MSQLPSLADEISAFYQGLGDRSRHALLTVLSLAAQKLGTFASRSNSVREWLEIEELISRAELAIPCPPQHPINAVFSSVAIPRSSKDEATTNTIWLSGGIRSALDLAAAVSSERSITCAHVGSPGRARSLSVERLCEHFEAPLQFFDDWDRASFASGERPSERTSGLIAARSRFEDYSYRFLARAAVRLRVPLEHIHACENPDAVCGRCFGCLEWKKVLGSCDSQASSGRGISQGCQLASALPQLALIVGRPFSGSTILATALGSQEGILDLGEVGKLPELVLSGGLCSCGEEFSACPFWSPFLPFLPRPFSHGGSSFGPDGIQEWLTFYSHISTRHGRATLIDSSKDPERAAAIRTASPYAKVIHLTRSPLDAVRSDKKYRGAHWPEERTLSSWINAHRYILDTFAADPVGYAQVRYEDFVENPQEVIERIILFLGKRSPQLRLRLRRGHHVGGNRLDWGKGISSPPSPEVSCARIEADPQAGRILRDLGYCPGES